MNSGRGDARVSMNKHVRSEEHRPPRCNLSLTFPGQMMVTTAVRCIALCPISLLVLVLVLPQEVQLGPH